MPDYKPLFENVAQDPLVGELGNILHHLFVYTGEQSNIDLKGFAAVLINFKHVVENSNQFLLNTLINDAIGLGKTLILLNVHDGQHLSKMLGVGLQSKCLIVKPYDQYNVFHVLGLAESEQLDCGQANVIQNTDGSSSFNILNVNNCDSYSIRNECQSFFGNFSVEKQARIVESILSSDFKLPADLGSETVGNTPADLPSTQFKLNYLAIEGKWNLSDQQVTNNSIVMEIALIASYNPKYKYLRIRSVGAGFNPANGGDMQSDSTYDRGYFQSRVNIHMQPNTEKLRTLSTEPKNVNKQTQYTTSSQFSVGVDITKNPSFNSSYTISESMTTTVADFNVYNNGAGVIGDWDFVLSMTEESIWDIFSEPFMKKGQVKALPALATKNLQTVTETVWYADSSLNETLGLQLYWKVDHYHCWVTGNWTDFTEHYSHKWKTVGYKDTPVYLDFSSVYA